MHIFHKYVYTKLNNAAGWSSLEARRAHNPKVVGSNPAPATLFFAQIAQSVEQGTENPCVAGSIPALGICSVKKDKQLNTWSISSVGRALDF